MRAVHYSEIYSVLYFYSKNIFLHIFAIVGYVLKHFGIYVIYNKTKIMMRKYGIWPLNKIKRLDNVEGKLVLYNRLIWQNNLAYKSFKYVTFIFIITKHERTSYLNFVYAIIFTEMNYFVSPYFFTLFFLWKNNCDDD